jgi:hypothetical protein
MTMLSYTSNYEFPVLVGDILITSVNKDENLSIPTHLDGLKNVLQDYQLLSNPSDLRQKIYIVNDRLCVALGGRLDQMCSFLNALMSYFKEAFISEFELDEFLNNYDRDKLDHLAALILLIDIKEDNIHFIKKIWGDWQKETHNEFERIFAIGTGASEYLQTAKQYKGGVGHTNFFNKSIAQNLDLLSKFLVFESATAETILNRWGAGFEVIYLFNQKFKKLDDYTFVLFSGTFNMDSGLDCHPTSVFKYKYHDELLLIRAADNIKEKLFIVNPINKEPNNYNLKISKPDYNSKHFIVAYLIRLPNGKLYAPTFVLLVDQGNILIQDHTKHLQITVKSWLLDKITSEIKNVLKK